MLYLRASLLNDIIYRFQKNDIKPQIITIKTCKATFILESLPDAGPDTIMDIIINDGDNEVDIPDNTIDTSFEDINDAGKETGIDTITRIDVSSYTLVNEKDLSNGCSCSFVE